MPVIKVPDIASVDLTPAARKINLQCLTPSLCHENDGNGHDLPGTVAYGFA